MSQVLKVVMLVVGALAMSVSFAGSDYTVKLKKAKASIEELCQGYIEGEAECYDALGYELTVRTYIGEDGYYVPKAEYVTPEELAIRQWIRGKHSVVTFGRLPPSVIETIRARFEPEDGEDGA